MLLQIQKQARFTIQINWPCWKATTSLSNCRVCVGVQSEAVFIFYWLSPMLHVNSCEKVNLHKRNRSESVEINAEPDHLALPTMLSALKHEWGILALFVVVDRSQPNHTRLAVKIQNEYRAAVTDDWARCDTRKNLSLVLPLAALRITNGNRKSTSMSLYSIQTK